MDKFLEEYEKYREKSPKSRLIEKELCYALGTSEKNKEGFCGITRREELTDGQKALYHRLNRKERILMNAIFEIVPNQEIICKHGQIAIQHKDFGPTNYERAKEIENSQSNRRIAHDIRVEDQRGQTLYMNSDYDKIAAFIPGLDNQEKIYRLNLLTELLGNYRTDTTNTEKENSRGKYHGVRCIKWGTIGRKRDVHHNSSNKIRLGRDIKEFNPKDPIAPRITTLGD